MGEPVKIDPTVGRILWFTPNQQEEKGFRLDPNQPCTAQITYVHPDGTVNAVVWTHECIPCNMFKLRVLQDGEPTPPKTERYLAWMPYQKGQAAKSRDPLPAVKPVLVDLPKSEAQLDADTKAMYNGEMPGADPDGLGG